MFVTPGWVGLTLFVWAAAVAMVLLGSWQLRVSNSKHFNLQNFGYALQWWVFSAFVVLFWVKVIRDAWRGGATAAPTTGGQLVVRAGQTGVAHVGPADLVAPPDQPDGAPVVYRGYVMPQSATRPARSGGDPMHGSYNDYLWQLALADSADRADPET
ncbi:MAG: hypothetical protein JWO57_2932 [Pseudonocardiales bacterium]|nr:hypothetical protein [Pseudonocardiales bacterium]